MAKITTNITKPTSSFFPPVLTSKAKSPYPQLKCTYKTETIASAITDATAAPSAPKFGISRRFKIKLTTDPKIK